MSKPNKEQKVKRRAVKAARKTAKKRAKDVRDDVKRRFGDGLDRLEEPREE